MIGMTVPKYLKYLHLTANQENLGWSISIKKSLNTTCSFSEKDKYSMISLRCGISNMKQMNISTKQKQTYRHRAKLMVTRGLEGGRGMGWKSEISGCNKENR